MKKAVLLAAIAYVAMVALPAAASAGTWHVEPEGEAALQLAGSGGEANVTTKEFVFANCIKNTIVGEYETTTTGWVQLGFHGCITKLGLSQPACTTPGQPTGTIITTKLTFHNVMLENDKPGILITPNHETNTFAHYNCGGVVSTVIGSGLLGEITGLECGGSAASATVNFLSSGEGIAQWTQVTTSGTVYQPEVTLGGGGPRKWSLDSIATINYSENFKANCT